MADVYLSYRGLKRISTRSLEERIKLTEDKWQDEEKINLLLPGLPELFRSSFRLWERRPSSGRDDTTVSTQLAAAFHPIFLRWGFSCQQVLFAACRTSVCCSLCRIGVTDVSPPLAYLNRSVFYGTERGSVSGDLMNTWRMCKTLRYTPIRASSHRLWIWKQFFMSINRSMCQDRQIRDAWIKLWLQHQEKLRSHRETVEFQLTGRK